MIMADATKEIQFEIGHVLFIDIVGYSKLLIEEQKARLNQLTRSCWPRRSGICGHWLITRRMALIGGQTHRK